MKFRRFLYMATVAAVVAAGCAKTEDEPANESDKMYFDAWIQTHVPDAERIGMGVYVVKKSADSGESTVELPGYARITYTVRDLDGNVSSTSDPLIARQIGDYHPSYYYGSRVWYASETSIAKGVQDMLTDMNVGDTMTAVIPGWLQTYNRYGTEEEYLKNITGNSPAIYTIAFDEFTDDIEQWQIDSIENYWMKTWGEKPDSLFRGFYYKQLTAPAEGTAEDLHADTTIYINYTGRLLNGQVFDTTNERIAKDYNIFSESKTYEPAEVTMSTDSTAIELGGSSVVSGFSNILWRMGAMESGVGIFYSNLGYGSSGSGNLIPEYAPLIFEIQIVEDPDAEE